MTQGELAAGRGAFAVPGTLDEVVARFEELLGPMERARDARRYFHKLYLRTTLALDSILDQGGFEDPAAMARWGVTFANFYLEALHQADTGQQPSGPWQVAFAAAARNTVPPLRHMLLGMNAHINYDLPLTLLELIDDAEFDDPAVVDRWHRDIEYGNKVLAARVGPEDEELFREEGGRSLVDRLLTPLNRLATARFLAESRRKAWANARALSRARRQGTEGYTTRVAELEQRCRDRVAELVAPRSNSGVLLSLGARGFGVLLASARVEQRRRPPPR